MYVGDLNEKIGRDNGNAEKVSRKGFKRPICGSLMQQICNFEVSVMLSFSKILGHHLIGLFELHNPGIQRSARILELCNSISRWYSIIAITRTLELQNC